MNIKSIKPIPRRIKVPAPPKALDREFRAMLKEMVSKISTRFENQTLNELNKSTIDKFADSKFSHVKEVEFNGESFAFADAQTGNYAKIFLELSKSAKSSILKTFSDDKIEDLVSKFLSKVKDSNSKSMYGQISEITGISYADLVKKEGLNPETNALYLETAQWAKKLRDDTLEGYISTSLRGMSLGMGLDEVFDQFFKSKASWTERADLIARTQIGTFNSVLTKVRAKNIGIQKAIWVSSRDERVRPSHEDRDGKEFDLDKGLYSSIDGKWLIPGVDYNCRCDYYLIIPEDM